jgi:hypothetical protein
MAQIKQKRTYTLEMFPDATSYSRSERMNPIQITDLSYPDPNEAEFKEAKEPQEGSGNKTKWWDRHKMSKDYDDSKEYKKDREVVEKGTSEMIKSAGKGSHGGDEVISVKHKLLETQLENEARGDDLSGLMPSEILMYNLMNK